MENEDLKRCMKDYASDKKKQNKDRLVQAIQNANFLMPVVVEETEGTEPLVRFRMLYNKYGLAYFMAFTDPLEMAKCADGDQKILDVSYEQLKMMTLRDEEHNGGFVIDPKGDNLLITAELMRQFEHC